jgi:UDP-N-acetylmuramate dehydrogenase
MMNLQQNISLLPYNTFGMDCKCSFFFEYQKVEELLDFIQSDVFKTNKCFHIGGGSNLLFLSDFQGIILHSKISEVQLVNETSDEVFVRVGAGFVWDDFVAYAVSQNWAGIENLSLIPGEVGASAIQNIGAYGVEAKDVIYSVETIEIETGKKHIFSNEDCCFGYRDSIFKNQAKNKYVVTYVTYRLHKKPLFNLTYGNLKELLLQESELTLTTIRNVIIRIREEKLPNPKILGNGGSFFMNPVVTEDIFASIKKEYPQIPFYPQKNGFVKIPAGWLIEQCGWKGKNMGNAGVYEKQALVLVNRGTATPQEIVALSDKIIESVQQKFGVSIHPEVNFIK